MVAERLAAERQRARVVGVTPRGRGPVRTRVRGGEARHRLEPLEIPARHGQVEPPSKERGQQEELGHEPVVRGRHLEVDAVGRHLAGQLRDGAATSRSSPSASGARPAPKKRPAKTMPGRVCVEVVPVDVGELEVPRDEVAVQVDARAEAEAEARIAPRVAAAERVEEPGEREDAERGLHRARPVDALAVGVRLDPLVERLARLSRAWRSSRSSRYACPAGSSHCSREISHGTFTSLGRSSCAYSIVAPPRRRPRRLRS